MSVMSRAVFEEMRQQRKNTAKMAEAAAVNEQITRHRVEALEAVLGRGFWGRLRWLVMGR